MQARDKRGADVKSWVKDIAQNLGVAKLAKRAPDPVAHPPDATAQDREVLAGINGYTMTLVPRQMSLISAVRYLCQNRIAGDFVECGVWRGGSSMAMAMTLLQEGSRDRHLYLFDTFEGMTEPQDVDRRAKDGLAARLEMEQDVSRSGEVWAVAGLDDVQQNMARTGYPPQQLHFIKGPVESTIPAHSPPGPIALLRLDTDWYESTRHELIHLFPRLVPGGVLIIDDYGHWEGARKAVDEYFAALPSRYFFARTDYSGRLLVNVPIPTGR
jgi:O-methyltransferase